MAIWRDRNIHVHGDGVPHHPQRPNIYIDVAIESMVRNGTAVIATVSSGLRSLEYSESYFNYPISIALSIDDGNRTVILNKPSGDDQWADYEYSTSNIQVSSANTGEEAILHVWFQSDCLCTDDSWYEVASYTLEEEIIPPPVIEYTITWNANGGRFIWQGNDGTYHSETYVTSSTESTAPVPPEVIPTYIGHVLLSGNRRWNTQPDGTGSPLPQQVNSNITLYAQWSLDIVQVTFKNGYDIDGQDVVKVLQVVSGSDIATSEFPVLVHPRGLTFIRWIGANGPASAPVLYNVLSDTTLIAQWDWSPVWVLKDGRWIPYEPLEV